LDSLDKVKSPSPVIIQHDAMKDFQFPPNKSLSNNNRFDDDSKILVGEESSGNKTPPERLASTLPPFIGSPQTIDWEKKYGKHTTHQKKDSLLLKNSTPRKSVSKVIPLISSPWPLKNHMSITKVNAGGTQQDKGKDKVEEIELGELAHQRAGRDFSYPRKTSMPISAKDQGFEDVDLNDGAPGEPSLPAAVYFGGRITAPRNNNETRRLQELLSGVGPQMPDEISGMDWQTGLEPQLAYRPDNNRPDNNRPRGVISQHPQDEGQDHENPYAAEEPGIGPYIDAFDPANPSLDGLHPPSAVFTVDSGQVRARHIQVLAKYEPYILWGLGSGLFALAISCTASITILADNITHDLITTSGNVFWIIISVILFVVFTIVFVVLYGRVQRRLGQNQRVFDPEHGPGELNTAASVLGTPLAQAHPTVTVTSVTPVHDRAPTPYYIFGGQNGHNDDSYATQATYGSGREAYGESNIIDVNQWPYGHHTVRRALSQVSLNGEMSNYELRARGLQPSTTGASIMSLLGEGGIQEPYSVLGTEGAPPIPPTSRPPTPMPGTEAAEARRHRYYNSVDIACGRIPM
jgi:hypothetical protein